MNPCSRYLSPGVVLITAAIATLTPPAAAADTPSPKPWSVQDAWTWYQRQPWLLGCNFLPSTAVNDVEMWRAETFDRETIDRELGWASATGLNAVRVFLNYVVWEEDPEGLKHRFNAFLELADHHNLKVMPLLFDDCNFANRVAKAEPQPDPVPGVHNSQWVSSPPLALVTDRSQWDGLERYVNDLVGTFGHDPRVILWDLYNEPGSSGLGNQSLPLVEATFAWARETHPQQPLTMGVWGAPPEISRRMLELSDIVSFHQYGNPTATKAALARFRQTGRPLLCTEWLCRQVGNSVATILPLFARERIGCFHWGLVSGRTQTTFPWGSPEGAPKPAVWQHDLLHPDGTPYDPAEPLLFRQLAGRLRPRLDSSRYRDWDSTRLANGLVQVETAPDIGGRIIQYRLGPHEFFWVNPDLAGQVSPPSGLGPDGKWLNYGGDKLWPAPQGWDNEEQWPGPPDAVLDGQPFTLERSPGSPGAAAIRLTSREDPRSGIQFVRTVRLLAGSTRVMHEVTMKNVDTRSRRWGIWTVTQLNGAHADGPGFNPHLTAWCRVNPRSHFPRGYAVLFGNQDNPTFSREGDRFRLDYQYQVGKAVLDSAAGWTATVDGQTGCVFVQRFVYEPTRDYPDGASVEFWSSGLGTIQLGDATETMADNPRETPFLIESELVSPFARLEPGETYTWRFEWAATQIGGSFPVIDCSAFGLVAEPLSARYVRRKLNLRARFGVFQPGSLHTLFFDSTGAELASETLPIPVSPLHAAVVNVALAAPPEAKTVSLVLHDADGRRLGEMAHASLPPEIRLTVILPTAESQPVHWRYTVQRPADTWFQPGFDDSNWDQGPAPFGTREVQHGRRPRTEWTRADIWLRRTFELPETPPGLTLLRLHHDEDTEVYLNGTLASRIPGYNAAYDLFELTPAAQDTLRPGTNVLAVHCHQTAGGQFLDLGLVAEPQ